MSAPQQTILIVDDAPSNLAVLSDFLGVAGYRVLTARDGVTAIDIARRARPHLVMLDVRMPELGGFETCRRLKEDVQTRDIPVVFMTGLDDTEERTTGLEVGGVDFITKTIGVDDLLQRIRLHISPNTMRGL